MLKIFDIEKNTKIKLWSIFDVLSNPGFSGAIFELSMLSSTPYTTPYLQCGTRVARNDKNMIIPSKTHKSKIPD